MNMNTLKYFAAVAQTQQITKAAKQLHVTQPALSTAIQRLEDEIGFQLFDRKGQNITLNRYGEIFLKTVTAIENAMNEGLEEMELLRQHEIHFVRIACSSSSLNDPQLMGKFFSNNISLNVDTIPQNWEEELLCGDLDLVITMCPSQHPDICGTVLCRREFKFVSSKDHPLAAAKSLTTDDLRAYPFCSINNTRSSLYVAKDIFDRVNFCPVIRFLGRDTIDLLSAIRSGKYLGLIASKRLKAIDDLAVLPVENVHIDLPVKLYWCRNRSKNAALDFARQTIIDFYRALPPE